MDAPSRGSVSHWLEGLRDGDSVAAQELWNRYFSRLAPIAKRRLMRLNRELCGEDIALSALKSVMIGVRENRYPELSNRESLWPLLVMITARKSISEQRRQLAQKRTATRDRPLDDLQAYLGAEPSVEFAAEVADQLELLIQKVGDAQLRRLIECKLSGYSNEEIAVEFDCSRRTVIRKLNRVRQEWLAIEQETGHSPGQD